MEKCAAQLSGDAGWLTGNSWGNSHQKNDRIQKVSYGEGEMVELKSQIVLGTKTAVLCARWMRAQGYQMQRTGKGIWNAIDSNGDIAHVIAISLYVQDDKFYTFDLPERKIQIEMPKQNFDSVMSWRFSHGL